MEIDCICCMIFFRYTLGTVLQCLGQMSTASDCQITAASLESSSPIVPFTIIPKLMQWSIEIKSIIIVTLSLCPYTLSLFTIWYFPCHIMICTPLASYHSFMSVVKWSAQSHRQRLSLWMPKFIRSDWLECWR